MTWDNDIEPWFSSNTVWWHGEMQQDGGKWANIMSQNEEIKQCGGFSKAQQSPLKLCQCVAISHHLLKIISKSYVWRRSSQINFWLGKIVKTQKDTTSHHLPIELLYVCVLSIILWPWTNLIIMMSFHMIEQQFKEQCFIFVQENKIPPSISALYCISLWPLAHF